MRRNIGSLNETCGNLAGLREAVIMEKPDTPKQTGWYWVRVKKTDSDFPKNKWIPVEIVENDGELLTSKLIVEWHDEHWNMDLDKWEWGGPIPEPV